MLPAYRYISALYKAASQHKRANALMGGQDAMPTAEGGPPPSSGMPEMGAAPGQGQQAPQIPPEVIELAKAIMQEHPDCDPETAIQVALQQLSTMGDTGQGGQPPQAGQEPGAQQTPEAKLGAYHAIHPKDGGRPHLRKVPENHRRLTGAVARLKDRLKAHEAHETPEDEERESPEFQRVEDALGTEKHKKEGAERPGAIETIGNHADRGRTLGGILGGGAGLLAGAHGGLGESLAGGIVGLLMGRRLGSAGGLLTGSAHALHNRLSQPPEQLQHGEKAQPPRFYSGDSSPEFQRIDRELGTKKHASLSPMTAGFLTGFIKESAAQDGDMEKLAWTGMPRQAQCNIAEELDRVGRLVNHYPGGQFEGSMSLEYMMGKLSQSDRVATSKEAMMGVAKFNSSRPMLSKKKKKDQAA